jgi:hypothetical protein
MLLPFSTLREHEALARSLPIVSSQYAISSSIAIADIARFRKNMGWHVASEQLSRRDAAAGSTPAPIIVVVDNTDSRHPTKPVNITESNKTQDSKASIIHNMTHKARLLPYSPLLCAQNVHSNTSPGFKIKCIWRLDSIIDPKQAKKISIDVAALPMPLTRPKDSLNDHISHLTLGRLRRLPYRRIVLLFLLLGNTLDNLDFNDIPDLTRWRDTPQGKLFGVPTKPGR